MKLVSGVIIGLAFLISAAAAHAVPVVSVDTDPATPDVQSDFDIAIGNPLTIDVVISGVDVGLPLNAFEFDLDFDPSILTAISVIDGGFLLAPVFEIQNIIGAMKVEFAEQTLFLTGAIGAGTLATITFDTIGLGTSPLDLNDVILSAPFGVPINVGAINDGSVNVVPEPSSLLLLGSGLAGLAGWRRRRLKRPV